MANEWTNWKEHGITKDTPDSILFGAGTIHQYMKGSYGRVDMGAVMAALILAVIPVVIFYLACQKHIIKGVAAGAVKG